MGETSPPSAAPQASRSPSLAPSLAPSRSPAPSGRPFAAWLLLAGAAALLLEAIVHGVGYAATLLAVQNSGLKPWFQQSIRALWVGHSLQLVVIAAILVVAALKPGSVSRPVVVLCGFLPILSGLLLALYNQSVFHTVMFLAATLLVVAGALLLPAAPGGQGPRA